MLALQMSEAVKGMLAAFEVFEDEGGGLKRAAFVSSFSLPLSPH